VLPESNSERHPKLLTKPAIGTVRTRVILGPTQKLWDFNL
jgi:hypothetical protein